MTNKNVATHVASAISALGAFAALLHPGFSLSSGVQATVVSVCTFVAGALQFGHLFLHSKFAREFTVAEHYALEVAKQLSKQQHPSNMPAPEVPAAPAAPTA